MEIYGKEIKFLTSVGAICDISEVCPKHEIGRLNDAFAKGDYQTKVQIMATVVSAMNKGYEMHEAFAAKHRGESYKATWLTVEECESLSQEDLLELFSEAIDSLNSDKQTVKAQGKPGKKTEEEPGSN